MAATLLTATGRIDRAACAALAATFIPRCFPSTDPSYTGRFSVALAQAEVLARDEQVRIGLSPAEIAVLDVADLRRMNPYPNGETSRHIRRLEIQAEADLARERAAVPALLAAE